MNMIEKVARALCVSNLDDPDDRTSNIPDGVTYPMWTCYTKAAIDAIEAMRDPTDAMTSAGVEAWRNHYLSPVTQWRAMIDAALTDGGE